MSPDTVIANSPSGLGPLEVIYSWQSLLMSVIVYATTRSAKGSVYLLAGGDPRKNLWVKHAVLPVLPLAIGSLVCMVIPMRPPLIEEYAAASGSAWAVYAAFGACIGQFADYLHQRIEGILKLKSPSDISA